MAIKGVPLSMFAKNALPEKKDLDPYWAFVREIFHLS